MGYSQYQTQLNEGAIKPGYTITTTNLWVPEDFKIQPDGTLEPVNKQEKLVRTEKISNAKLTEYKGSDGQSYFFINGEEISANAARQLGPEDQKEVQEQFNKSWAGN